ncbi:MAG TPA: mechanosensitive ion channel family protein [Gemmatimonadales bacterium]|jgi:small conductance mechanosensitive channel
MFIRFIPLFSIGDILQRIAEILKIDAAEAARSGARVIGVWLLAFIAYRIVGLLARRIEKTVDDHDDSITTTRERRGQTIAQLLRSMGRVVIVAVAILLTFNIFIDIGPILAGAGILGLAVSFGAQSLVKDVISGFFILFENQFALGDVIEAGGKSGTVEKMTLRVVVLRDVYGVMHVIPNSEIKVVSNKTRGWSRAVVDVGVGRDVDVDRALDVVRDEATRFSNDPKWKQDLDGPVEVLGVESISDNSVIIRSLVRTRPGSQWSVGREFRRRMKARLYREEIEIPYPVRPPHTRSDGAPAPSPAEANTATTSRG